MRVVLFDIDGTLVWTNGAGRRAMERALASAFGTSGPSGQRYDGKTDMQIVREAMRLVGFADDVIDSRMEAVCTSYLGELARELGGPHHGAILLPGVTALLDALAERNDVLVGLLTGNLVAGAVHKLRAVGVSPERFAVGAYGSDHEHRSELPAIAQARASALLGREVPGGSCVIVGDTPSDVSCGRGIGARAIAVATGFYDIAALAACAPAMVLADLTDTDAVVRAIVDA